MKARAVGSVYAVVFWFFKGGSAGPAMLSLHGNFNEAKTTFSRQERQLFLAFIQQYFKREKKTEKRKKKAVVPGCARPGCQGFC